MKHLIKFLIIILLFSSLIQCKKSTEKDEYEIVNLILLQNITAYEIKILPPKKIPFGSAEHKKFNDSLVNNLKLTYYLKPVFYKLDTLKYNVTFKSLEDYESTLFLIDTTGRKIDFSKIKIDNYKRVEKIPCRDKYLDNCNQYFVASFKLSEIIINKNKAYTEINFQCGGKCGKGIKYELKKINGIWKIIKEDLLWIS